MPPLPAAGPPEPPKLSQSLVPPPVLPKELSLPKVLELLFSIASSIAAPTPGPPDPCLSVLYIDVEEAETPKPLFVPALLLYIKDEIPPPVPP